MLPSDWSINYVSIWSLPVDNSESQVLAFELYVLKLIYLTPNVYIFYLFAASIFGLGAIVGGLSAAYLGNRFGRRVALLCLVLPDLLSWVLVATAQNLPMMLVGRFLAGMAAAGYSPNIQIFVQEIAQTEHRGWLSGITVPVLGQL